MAGSVHDDDESVLDLAEQTNRPADVALNQQRIEAWHPILDPVWVIFALFYLGVIFIPVGFKVDSLQNNIVELKVTYDGYNDPAAQAICGINNTYNANKSCTLTMTVTDDMAPPVLVYYELTNFHQNHRKYFQSYDAYQLLGKVGGQSKTSKEQCDIINTLGNITINPCGFVPNTLFNDVFTLTAGKDVNGDPLVISETGIAWASDLRYRYAQPDGFKYEVCPPEFNCNASCCDDWSCPTPYVNPTNGTCYRYDYPNDNTTQYLYETYPMVVNPLEGVKNEHFAVWMRVATQPRFRKLYGWINQPIPKGEELNFTIQANWAVERHRGSKSLLVTTTNIFGGKNPYMGGVFVGVGLFCIAVATLFSIKQLFFPRKMADPAYLQYKPI